MILSVEFNTREKADRCLKSLGTRGIDVMTIWYNGKQIGGFIVHYFKQQKSDFKR